MYFLILNINPLNLNLEYSYYLFYYYQNHRHKKNLQKKIFCKENAIDPYLVFLCFLFQLFTYLLYYHLTPIIHNLYL